MVILAGVALGATGLAGGDVVTWGWWDWQGWHCVIQGWQEVTWGR